MFNGKQIQCFWAVRHEVRQSSDALCDLFIDILTGRDRQCGLDYRAKIQYEAVQEYNESHGAALKWKPANNTKILKDFEDQYPKSLTLGIQHHNYGIYNHIIYKNINIYRKNRGFEQNYL